MKNIQLSPKLVLAKFKHYVSSLQRYTVFAFIILVLGMYGFLILQINLASQAEPSEQAINEKLTQVKRLKIDQDSIDKIQQLEDQSVGVQTLFETARDNPFQDE